MKVTNFRLDDFQDGTPSELIPRYNRVWEPIDYTIKDQNEVQVITNLFIIANQTQGTCPGYSNFCNDTVKCEKGKTSTFNAMQSGVQTGDCVQDDRYHNQSTCEIKGIVSKLTNMQNLRAFIFKVGAQLYIKRPLH